MNPDPLVADFYRALQDAKARRAKAQQQVAAVNAERRAALKELEAARREVERLVDGGTAALHEQRNLPLEGAA